MVAVDIIAPDLDRFAAEVEGAGRALGDLSGPSRVAATIALGDVRPPVKTGTLADTVEAIPEALGFTLRAGGPRAPYGPIVHARNPFLTRALTAREEDVVDAYADHVDLQLSSIDTH